jgi:hypothetical protein
MTLANSRIWVKAWLEQGRTKEAKDLISKWPELVEEYSEKPKTTKTSKTSK